jgi:LEA14-like dessication related protein
MKRFYPILLLISTLFFMPSCRTPKDLEFREYNSVSVENMGFTSSSLKMNLVYYNPNNFGLELKRTELDIYVDSTFLGHSSQDLQVAVPKRGTFTIPLRVELDMKNLLKNGLTTLFNKQVMVRAIGNVKIGKAGVYKNFKVDYSSLQQFSLF